MVFFSVVRIVSNHRTVSAVVRLDEVARLHARKKVLPRRRNKFLILCRPLPQSSSNFVLKLELICDWNHVSSPIVILASSFRMRSENYNFLVLVRQLEIVLMTFYFFLVRSLVLPGRCLMSS